MIEICCGSFDDAMAASIGGAKRIELNSALYLGGLTPSLGSLLMTKQYADLEVITMIRPRGTGFFYRENEFAQMSEDAKLMLAYQADGLAFGCLDGDGRVDEIKTKELVKIAHESGAQAVFHRAFDCTKNPEEAMETLIDLGVDRVLTSGHGENVMTGIEELARLQHDYGNQIEILAGCGVNAENLAKLKEATGIKQYHSSCKGWKHDGTGKTEKLSFGYATDELGYEAVDQELVKHLIELDQ